jgi:hypothetical protein
MNDLMPLALGFVSLLLLPSLGVIGMFRQKVTPVLTAAVFVWLLGGVWALSTGWSGGLSEQRFLRLWLVGLTVGGGLLLVARLREKRKTWRWIRLALAIATIVVFVKALLAYVQTYA